jgi:phosphatidylglycerol---prolipoprotein diacylglyceryl transferase
MFINNINPVLLSLGPVSIRYYGLVYALGFLVTYFMLHKIAKKGKIKNFDADKADSFSLYLIVGVIVGARFFDFLYYHPALLWQQPLELFKIWHGGMSFHGGIIGAGIAAWLFCRKYKVNFYKLADIVVIPAAFFLFLGRITNFVNGELYGTITNVPWAVNFNNERDALGNLVYRHPSQLYEAAKNLVILFTLLFMHYKKKLKEGVLFWTFVVMYGALRFMITFLRDDPKLFGLSGGQYLSLLMVIAGTAFLIRIQHPSYRNKKSG